MSGNIRIYRYSGVARVAEVGGQAGGKGLHQGGKHIREPEEPTIYRREVQRPLQGPRTSDISDSLRSLLRALIAFIYIKKTT